MKKMNLNISRNNFKVNVFPLIICLILFSIGNALSQTFVPLPVSGFNHDLIAEGSGGINRAEATTTITFDGVNAGGDNVMYSTDFRGNTNPNTPPPFGLPVDRMIVSVNLPGANYLLAPYDQNNTLVLKDNNSTGTLVLETPGVFSQIAFLGSSAEGASNFDVILNFSDGTSSSSSFSVPDWYDGPNFAIQGIGRVSRIQVDIQNPDVFTGDAFNPRLYDNQITLFAPFNTRILTSITFTKTSVAGSAAILSVNGITAINAPDAPLAIAGSDVTDISFTANWLSSPGANSYFLDVSTNSNFTSFVGIYNNFSVGNTLSQNISGLSASTSYYYRVRAENASGISPSSNTIEVNFSPCPTGDAILSTQEKVNQFLIDYPNCTEIPGNLYIGVSTGNSDITDLTPLKNLTTVRGYLVVYSTSASNLNGLNNLTSIMFDIDIRFNSVLSDISALKNTSFNPDGGFGLTIVDNPALSVCDLPNFCTYLTNPAATHPRIISGNAGDCITEQAVADACSGAPVEGDNCSDAIIINNLFGHPINEPQNSFTYNTVGYNSLNDPTFGQECLSDNNTIWFKFTGDGFRYSVRSNDCGTKIFTDPNGAMYSGDCGDLTAIKCHRDISGSDENPDANFKITVQTEVGKTYYLMVEVSSTDDFETYFKDGEFCLEVTKVDPECLVDIPDANFKAYLIENFDINKNGDDEIQCEEAEGYFNQIDCSQLGITNLKGIEAFIYISDLNCSGNELSSIDLTKNTFLKTLNCSNNNLSNLNLINNFQLYDIKCSGNRLSALDVSKMEGLDELDCSDNLLVSLDVSQNTILRSLLCSSNQLVYLNVANGRNENMIRIEANDNPNLTCVQVDDVAYSNENWTSGAFLFDPQSIFSEYCEPCVSSGNISANFLVSSTACIGDDIRVIEYGVFDSIPDPVTFSWNFGNGQTSIERDPIVSYNAPGTYTITLELGNTECPMKLVKDINILSCLKNPKGNVYSEVMPNPSAGPIHLKTRLPLESDAVVSIYDLNGNVIYNKKFRSVDTIDENITIESTGTYILEVRHVLGSEKMKLFVIE